MKFQNLWSSFVIKEYWNVLKLFPVAKAGMDGNGLKLKKNCQVLMLRVPKVLKKFIMASPLWQSSFDIFVAALQKQFVYD